MKIIRGATRKPWPEHKPDKMIGSGKRRLMMTSRFLHVADRAAGFTLLEVMISVAVIAISLTALLGLQSQSISLANEAKINTLAGLLAQSKMAQILGQEADILAASSGDFGDDYPEFRWEVEQKEASAGDAADLSDYLMQIDLTLSWGHGGRYKYHLRSYHFIAESAG